MKNKSSTPRKRKVSFVTSSSSTSDDGDVTLKNLRKKKIKRISTIDIKEEVTLILSRFNDSQLKEVQVLLGSNPLQSY